MAVAVTRSAPACTCVEVLVAEALAEVHAEAVAAEERGEGLGGDHLHRRDAHAR